MRTPVLLVVLAACSGKGDEPPRLDDTGWFGTDTTDTRCEEEIVETEPAAGDNDWYWRDRPQIFVAAPSDTAYRVWLQDAARNRIDGRLAWDETELAASFEWDGWLAASTDYELVIEDCRRTTTIPFRTSTLGTPLAMEPGDLVGRTYLLDLVGAQWQEPPLLGGLISGFFTDPVLIGVTHADAVRIDIVGAPGVIDSFGVIKQNPNASTWDFPVADFDEAPYLDARAPRVLLAYDGTCQASVPVQDFVFQGTFSADGNTIGGAVLSGLGDSRDLGCLVSQPDNPAAVCDIAAGLGIECEPCADGEPYCLYLEARGLQGILLPDLHLSEIDL